jgi:probable HAF family extracellular repeat protein
MTRMIVIPAAVAQARILDSRWIRLAVTVVRDEEAETWPLSAAMVLSAVDVEVTLQPGNEVRLGQLVTAKVNVRNLLNGPLAGATLHVTSAGSLYDSRPGDSPIIIPTLASGTTATYMISFTSVAEGAGLISASVVGQATLYGSSSSAVDVRNCGTMQDIGAFPGPANSSQATGVSADGSVVVGWGNSSNGDRAFRWTAAGGMQDLGSLMLGTMSRAFGVSADGAVVVGESGNRAFRWTAAGGMQSLGTLPGAFDSTAAGTSVDGSVVVGWVSTGDGVRAFRWTASGGMQSLGTLPGGERSYARAVSGDGSVVVGESDSSDGTRAFRWTAAGGMQSLGTLPGGLHSYAYGVSADGAVVVGRGEASEGIPAFRWTAAGGMQSLGTLQGGTFSQAQGVSADGSLVVGFGDSANGLRAFLWIAGGGMQSLGTLPEGTRSTANGISADGSVVVGVGDLVNFERAFRWSCSTPVPPCPADITNTDGDLPSVPDGAVDNGDFQAFFAAFFMPEADPLRLAADIANTDGETVLTGGGPDGAIDNGDFNAFFAAFFGGCP